MFASRVATRVIAVSLLTGGLLATPSLAGTSGAEPQPHVAVAGYASPDAERFALVYADGSVRPSTFGDAFSLNLGLRITGGARVPTGGGYWEVAADGNVFGYGTAPALGGMGGFPINAPIFALAPTPSGKGYWLAGRDGGVFTFGDARFHGSASARHLNQPVVGITTSPTGKGYRLVSRDGGVFAFGQAPFAGSLPRRHVRANDVVGIASTPSDKGYWIARRNGRVYAFGNAEPLGGAQVSTCDPIVAIIPNPVAQGYRLVTDSGRTIPRGVAPGGDQPTGTNRVCGKVTARIELPATTIVAGERMTGFLIVDNQARNPLRLSSHGCRPLWTVSVSSEATLNSPTFAQGCLRRPLTFPVGATQHPFTMRARYLIGLNPCKCLGPLPPGDYAARLFHSGPFLPVASVPIEVTAPPT